jgi:hypothetical protein
MVENALAKGIPVVIGFLASLLGLGGISDKIKSVIEAIRKPIGEAIDWVIHKAVSLVKAGGKFIAGLFGGKKDKKDEPAKEADPAKAAKVEAGLAAIDAAEQAREKEGKISKQDAEAVAAQVKSQHPIFKSLTVADGGDRWKYLYSASPSDEKLGSVPKKVLRMEAVPLLFKCNMRGGYGVANPLTAYDEQLKRHESRLNDMRVDEYIAKQGQVFERKMLTGSSRSEESGKLTRTSRAKFRLDRIVQLTDAQMTEELASRGQVSPKERDLLFTKISAEVAARVDREMSGAHMLHFPDQYVSGPDEPEAAGPARINMSIGAQWPSLKPRLDQLVYAFAEGATKEELHSTHLNVVLIAVPA